MHCQGGDDPVGGVGWRKAECHLCLNCVDQCPEHALAFQFFSSSSAIDGPNLQRRKLIAGAIAGAAVIPLTRSTNGYSNEHPERLLRPPGALDEETFPARRNVCSAPETFPRPAPREAAANARGVRWNIRWCCA